MSGLIEGILRENCIFNKTKLKANEIISTLDLPSPDFFPHGATNTDILQGAAWGSPKKLQSSRSWRLYEGAAAKADEWLSKLMDKAEAVRS